jgi:ribosome maturation factor RimP
MNRLESVCVLATEVAAETQVELYDVEFNGNRLRVFIDAPAKVTIGLCARFSELLARKLDTSNLILERYYLEVSSPGLERKLRGIADFERNQGRTARVVVPSGVVEGRILRVENGQVVMETQGPDEVKQEQTVAWADIRRANLKLNEKELFAKPRAAEPAAATSVKEI